MADHLSGWEVISKKRDKSSVGILFRDMLLFLFGWGTPHNPPVKFTVREKSTGYIKTVTAYDESELPERIAKGQFDFDRIISEDAAELILAGIRRGGEARALAFDNIEYVFRQRLQKGDIDPYEMLTNLQDVLRPAGEEAVQELTRRCSAWLKNANA
jgi:hypothetical protein